MTRVRAMSAGGVFRESPGQVFDIDQQVFDGVHFSFIIDESSPYQGNPRAYENDVENYADLVGRLNRIRLQGRFDKVITRAAIYHVESNISGHWSSIGELPSGSPQAGIIDDLFTIIKVRRPPLPGELVSGLHEALGGGAKGALTVHRSNNIVDYLAVRDKSGSLPFEAIEPAYSEFRDFWVSRIGGNLLSVELQLDQRAELVFEESRNEAWVASFLAKLRRIINDI